MRTNFVIKNMIIGLFSQIVIVLFGFFSRKIFIDTLGTDYLGVNGLMTNVLSMIGLVEGGIGLSIIYNLYTPLANNDQETIIGLVQLYKKLYTYLASLFFLISIIFYPFLSFFVEDNVNISGVFIIYFIFVMKNFISYLNAHKWSLITADQKGYILTKYNLFFNIFTMIAKIFVLIKIQNYVLFLIVELLIFLIQTLLTGYVVEKHYGYIKTKKKYIVNDTIKANMKKNVKSIFLHNIGSYCVFGTDNLLISKFIGVATVGIYSNYTMIISQLSSLLSSVINSFGSSVGNLIALENEEKIYNVFKKINLIYFWLYSFSTIFMYVLLEPFIDWWLGEGFLLHHSVFIIILLNFYIRGMRSNILIFKEKAGIFSNDKYIPLLESVLNLGFSILLAKHYGLIGIFLGTTISTILLPLWIQAKIVYNEVFKVSVFIYFKEYILNICLMLFTGYIIKVLIDYLVNFDGFFGLITRGIICVIGVNVIYFIAFIKSEEFRYILKVIFDKLCLNNIKISSIIINK